MNNAIPVDKLPFRVMRTVQSVLAQTATAIVLELDSTHIRLAAEIWGALEITNRMKNPTRPQMLGNICAWYELTEIARDKLPEGELKSATTQLLTELGWIKELINRVREEKAQQTA